MKLEDSSLQRLVGNQTKLSDLFFFYTQVDMFLVSPNSFMNLSCSLTSLPLYSSNLKSLRKFYLSGCSFTGSYPRLLPNLTQIISSDLSHNNFGSQIPWSFLKLGQLSFLDFSFNSFTCQLLDASTNLAELSSSNSQPVSHTSLKLEFLALSYNLLNGTIPSWLYSTPRLQHLYLDNNLFTRHIDEFQYNLVRYLDLSNNNLVGSLPMAIYKFVSLYHIYVSFNHLSGTMESKMFSKLKILETVDLSHYPLLSLSTFNNFSYTLPKLYELYLSSCKINEFPFFLTNLENLECSFKVRDLSHNNTSDMIPSCLGNLSGSLSVLDLRNNKFRGTIPKTFTKGNKLRSLNLNVNQLEGILLRSLENCRHLEMLDLGNNKINDTFPHWLGTLRNLRVLVLRANSFHGTISYSMTKFSSTNLQIIDLSHNKFRALVIKALNISHNKLIGNMSSSLENLSNLEWLDLSSNKLTREIPGQLVDLTSLEVLNLSRNCLVGPIPQGNQFNTFSCDSYNGNMGLSALPLLRICGDDKGQQSLASSTIQEDDLKLRVH
ncbi:hypothetical protein ACB092_11G017200 [Castanea dentata]